MSCNFNMVFYSIDSTFFYLSKSNYSYSSWMDGLFCWCCKHLHEKLHTKLKHLRKKLVALSCRIKNYVRQVIATSNVTLQNATSNFSVDTHGASDDVIEHAVVVFSKVNNIALHKFTLPVLSNKIYFTIVTFDIFQATYNIVELLILCSKYDLT